MNRKEPFKWRHFQSESILLCVRWYLRYPLSCRHLEEMMGERGLLVSVFRRSVGDEIQKIIDTLDDCLLDISSGSELEEEDPQD